MGKIEIFINTEDHKNPKVEITESKMEFQTLLEEAKFRYTNGYSQSRIVDYVYENANNETQAEKILNIIL